MIYRLNQQKISRYFFGPVLLIISFFCENSIAQTLNDSTNIYLADPTIFNEQGMYYLYGTVEGNTGNGFIAYTSKNMKDWKKSTNTNAGFALKKGDVYGTANFWAPQVFADRHQLYMAYVADENIAIATGVSAAGPFTQKIVQPLAASVKQIDPFIFTDDDGKKYLYHVRLTKGNRIFVAEMEPDFSGIKLQTLTECITATFPWENTAHSEWPVTEGPSIIKHKGIYYLFYTANDFRNPDYAVGYATSKSPLGPWKKYAGNPIISKKNLGINGTGHGDFVLDGQHRLWYVFHTHFSDTKVSPRKTALVKCKFLRDASSGIDKVVVDKESFYYAHHR